MFYQFLKGHFLFHLFSPPFCGWFNQPWENRQHILTFEWGDTLVGAYVAPMTKVVVLVFIHYQYGKCGVFFMFPARSASQLKWSYNSFRFSSSLTLLLFCTSKFLLKIHLNDNNSCINLVMLHSVWLVFLFSRCFFSLCFFPFLENVNHLNNQVNRLRLCSQLKWIKRLAIATIALLPFVHYTKCTLSRSIYPLVCVHEACEHWLHTVQIRIKYTFSIRPFYLRSHTHTHNKFQYVKFGTIFT